VHGDANDVKQAESLPVLPTAREPVLLADAAECTPFTDARLTETFVRETPVSAQKRRIGWWWTSCVWENGVLAEHRNVIQDEAT